jgi:hypothetical protein
MSDFSELRDEHGADAAVEVPTKKLRSNTRAMFAANVQHSQEFWADERRKIERVDSMRNVTITLPKLKYMGDDNDQ